MKRQKRNILLLVLGGALMFVAGAATGVFIRLDSETPLEQYPLIAKRAQVDSPNDPRLNFVPLRSSLDDYLDTLRADSQNVSVYFEYLPSGVSIQINDSTESVAASLMKVPAVMTLYKAAQDGKLDLDKKVALKSEWLNSQYGNLYKKGEGYQITLRGAARLAMKESDNTAILLIFSELDYLANNKDNIMSYLDLEFETNSDSRVFIGPQSYSSLLKCLYLACYNTKSDSQEILGYLTESIFNDRLVRYIPEATLVAHKIGAYSEESQSDCGIFYIPERNFVLCVMVRGSDPEASKIIAEIARITYQFITNEEQ